MDFAHVPSLRPGARGIARLRLALTLLLLGMLVFSAYGTLSPSTVRCGLPGAVGCPGGILGPALVPAGTSEQWFAVTMYDWGFWIVDTTTGANETNSWNVFEGWTVHINATSLPANAAIGGTAYHGLGIELNATGQQLLSLAAPVGQWTPGSFIAPLSEYHHQHIWCTISCGPGHGGQQAWVLNIIPPLPLPHAGASANVTSGEAPLAVTLSGTASAGTPPYNVSWDFGDGSPLAYAANVTHTYTLGGDYSARFLVNDSKGMTAVAVVSVLVNSSAPLTAVTTATPSSMTAPFTTTLSVIPHGGAPPYAVSWSFGDGQTLSGPNLTQHLYEGPGVFAVVATVRDAAGATVRSLASVTALPPAGSFPVGIAASPTNGSAPIVVQLNATPGGGTAPYSYSWWFGDGSSGTGQTVNHQFNLSGSYEIAVFVHDATGRIGSGVVNLPVRVAPVGNGSDDGNGTNDLVALPSTTTGALTLYTLVTPSSGGSPLAVNATASVVGGTGMNETIGWNFGDGSTASGPYVSHIFAGVGTYNVTVTASDSGANTGSGGSTVSVEPLEMTIAANRTAGDAPLSVTTAVTIVGGTGRYGAVSWSWGDGSGGTGDLSNHTYAVFQTGTLTIEATATDSAGATVNASLAIVFDPPLLAALVAHLPASTTLPTPVEFTLTVSGGSGAYAASSLWNFGDGTSTRAASPANHSYGSLGDFLVTVETNDSAGTPVTASAWVNLTRSSAPAPPGAPGGSPPWSLTGVSDPNRAALILIGMIAASGLGLLYRRRRAAAKRKLGTTAPAKPAATAAKAPIPPPRAPPPVKGR